MDEKLPPQVQNQLMQLQQLQQQSQAMQEQKMQIEATLKETEKALEELEKTKDDLVYKGVGEILVKTDKETAKSELGEKKEMLNIRKQTLER